MVVSYLSFTIYVDMQKKATDSIHPMGMERWNPTNWSSSTVYFGIIKVTEGTSYSLTQMHI